MKGRGLYLVLVTIAEDLIVFHPSGIRVKIKPTSKGELYIGILLASVNIGICETMQ